RLAIEVKIAKDELASEGEVWELGQVSEFTCPECHGSLWQMHEGNILRFRCRTGHAYTSEALLVDLSESVEAMQWATVRGIEESAALMEHMSKHLRSTGDTETANHFLEQANHARHRAELVRQTLLQEDTLRLETEGNGSAPV